MSNTTTGPTRLSALAPTAALAAPRISCGICKKDNWHRDVNKLLARGLGYSAIFTALGGKGGSGPSNFLIRKHHLHTLEQRGIEYMGVVPPSVAARLEVQRAQKASQSMRAKATLAKKKLDSGDAYIETDRPEGASDDDLAQLIVDTAARGVKEGKLGVTVKDGLAAQAILERRAERSEGASLMLKLARLLSGAPIDAIEGTFQEIKEVGPGHSDLAAEIVPDETFFDPHMPMISKWGRRKTKITIGEAIPPWQKGIDLRARAKERAAARAE